MVRRNLLILLTGSFLLLFGMCAKEDNKDTEYPVIDLSSHGAYPHNCDSISRGETFTTIAFFSDNEELGAYSIDIHQNFDHHTHSADIDECNLGAVKEPVNPFQYIQSFEIPLGSKEYTMSQDIYVPQDADPGDYHYMIRLTDKAGWQTVYGIAIKIL